MRWRRNSSRTLALDLLRAFYEAASLTAFMTYYKSETKHGCEGYDPPNNSSPMIESDVRKRMH